jgi:predicted negative regulator of RcsB-dependent stress response
VDDYLSEREQVERIRQWWKQNGVFIIVGIGGGILSLVGWNAWQSYQLERAEQASAIYSVVAEAAMEGRVDEVRIGVERLAAGHGSSPYLQHGRLTLAATLVRAEQPADAIPELRLVMNEARDPQLKLIARLRLARLLAADGDHDGALAQLRGVEGGAFGPSIREIEGDVLAARGDTDGARRAYQEALDGAQAQAGIIDEEFVRLKLEALEQGSPVAQEAS